MPKVKHILIAFLFSIVMLPSSLAFAAEEPYSHDTVDHITNEMHASSYDNQALSAERLDVTLGSSLPSPQAFSPGMEIPLSATASGAGDGLEYKFVWEKGDWAEWGVIREPSPDPACIWAPAKSGDYTLYVDVADAGGRVVSGECDFSVTEEWSLDGLVLEPAGTLLAGSELRVFAGTSGNISALKYKFVWEKGDWAEWGVLQASAPQSAVAWKPMAPGAYTIYVDAVDSAGRVRTASRSLRVADALLSPELPSPQAFSPGMEIPLSATASGAGDGLEYKFVWEKGDWAEWGVIREPSPDPACIWAPAKSGDYTLYVDVADAGGRVVSGECDFSVTEEWSLDGLESDMESPQVFRRGMSVPLLAQTSGNTAALKYKFVWEKDDWAEWGVIQQSSSSPSCAWEPRASGDYRVYLDVTDSAGRTRSSSIAYLLVKPWSWQDGGIQVSSALQKAGQPVNITAITQGETGDLTYKFVWERRGWGQWGVIGRPSDASSCTFAPSEPGDYDIYVDVTDANGEVETVTCRYTAWRYEGVSLSLRTTFAGSVGSDVTVAPDLGCTPPPGGFSYKYVWSWNGWSRWGVLADSTSSASVRWTPTEGPGTYEFYVDVIVPGGAVETRSASRWIEGPVLTLPVPLYMQNPQLPTGCESVALTMALAFYGYPLATTTIADNYLTYSSFDFVNSFIGDPHTGFGLAVMAPGIQQAATRYLRSQGSVLQAYDITGTSFYDLLPYIAQGVPVIVWNSMYMNWPSGPIMSLYAYGRAYFMYANTHTVVISGYDYKNNNVLVSDSLVGTVWRNASDFASIYYRMGSQAVVIR